MPIHGYPGGVITANPTAPTVSSASGVWTTEQQLIATAAGNWPGYEYPISRSLRFNSADTAYLNRTPAGAGNLQTWTWSGWVKRSRLGVDNETIFALFDYLASPVTNKQHGLRFLSGDTIEYWCYQNPSYNGQKITTQVFRDVSAWYHIVAVWDTPNATAANRMRLYVNGSEVTTFGTNTNPTQNSNGEINRAFLHTIGTFYDPDYGSPTSSLNGYLTEINFIDGQALTPSSFGLNDPETGVWSPKRYTGTYGTNGFYVNFSDNSNTTAATLGKDYSGNGNNWTPNNFSVTAGAGNDSLVDSPTSYGTDTGAGGTVRGNYCTLYPLWKGANITMSNGNLDATMSAASDASFMSTITMTSGKWYWEVLLNSVSTDYPYIGVATPDFNYQAVGGNCIRSSATGFFKASNANKWNLSSSAYGSSFANGDIMMIAYDADNAKIYFGKNGTWEASSDPATGANPAFTSVNAPVTPAGFVYNCSWTMNFGQRAFAYTAPSGFKALCTQNLPTPTIGATSTTQANDYFDVTLYTGTDATQSITNSGSMQPDFVWVKARNGAYNHYLYDVIRGSTNALRSSTNGVESQAGDSTLVLQSTGFQVTGTGLGLNSNGTTIVGWQWKGGGTGVTNTAGTITSTVSANTTSGFSIVTATLGAAGVQGTVGHGLGVAPSMILFKTRSGATYNWSVFHTSIATDTTKYLRLNDTSATLTYSTVWGAALPTSTVFGVTGDGCGSPSNPFVAYCFAPVAGYSAFGSYTGNGSTDGPFVYLGFRPEFVMIKNATTAGTSWEMFDNARETSNLMDLELLANSSNAEGTYTYGDFVSNGFKLRSTNNGVNQSTATLIYMAFAENPFKYSLAR
jgi:hypothetical protein